VVKRDTVTAQIRASAAMTLAAAAAIAFAIVVTPRPAPAAPNDACSQALAYERIAASDSASRQASYDSAIAGLAANQRCSDPQMKLVNEAYLLSMRAPAEHDLKIGNWQRDFARANMLLIQCTNWPGLRNTRAGNDCATQRRYNEIITKTLTTQPTPAPSTSMRPAPPTPPAGGSSMPLPRPASPIPSPTPR
jgi:methionine-rich copper-binding protein CopC